MDFFFLSFTLLPFRDYSEGVWTHIVILVAFYTFSFVACFFLVLRALLVVLV